MPDSWLFYGFYATILLVPAGFYVRWLGRREKRVRKAAEDGSIFAEMPSGQRPHIDVSNCIGCQGCTSVCPEGQVLGMIGGKAAVIRPWRCIGHNLCVDACPVGAITLVRAMPGSSAKLPWLTSEYETSVDDMFIAGELGGLALIRNAVLQGRECVDHVASRLAARGKGPRSSGDEMYDVLIIGAGPAGVSAGLRAAESKLNYLVLERESVGGTIAKYPRQKLVMTTPITFPMYPTEKRRQLSKEHLTAFFAQVAAREDFHIRTNEPVTQIQKVDDCFLVTTDKNTYFAGAVILALGRAGTPNKLGVPGEELPKVMYRLIEADHYISKKILVVGGGDSAVEAAMGLAMQAGNDVTISYRRAEFGRIKERNSERLQSLTSSGQLRVLFNSAVLEIAESSVVIEVGQTRVELPNDYVWVFAGGQAPDEFLKKIGVRFGPKDLSREVVSEVSGAMAAAG